MKVSKILGSCYPETDFVLLPKKLYFPARTSNRYVIFWKYAPGCYLTFVSFVLFYLSNISFLNNSIFSCYSVLTDFCHYLHLPLDLFLFDVLLIKELYKEVVTVANVLNGCYTCVETEPKWFYYFDYTNVANENCVKFCME